MECEHVAAAMNDREDNREIQTLHLALGELENS